MAATSLMPPACRTRRPGASMTAHGIDRRTSLGSRLGRTCTNWHLSEAESASRLASSRSATTATITGTSLFAASSRPSIKAMSRRLATHRGCTKIISPESGSRALVPVASASTRSRDNAKPSVLRPLALARCCRNTESFLPVGVGNFNLIDIPVRRIFDIANSLGIRDIPEHETAVVGIGNN